MDWSNQLGPEDIRRQDRGCCERAVKFATHFHICAFFDSREEASHVLAPFYREAQQRGERNLHLVSEPLDAHRACLTAAGIDVAGCEHTGQLSLRTWPPEPGGIDVDRLLQAMDEATARDGQGLACHDAGGFEGLRVMSQMGWAVQHGGDRLDLLEYEARLNEVLDANRRLAICVYDLAPLDGATMMDLLRTHPLTMIGGVLRENPFFTPPAEMLRELSARRATGRRRGRPAPAALPVPSRSRRAE